MDSPGPLCGHTPWLHLVWKCFALDRFVESGSWWGTGLSDDVSHIQFGTRHGRCFRVMTRGLEMCVLDGVNTRSLIGSGCESFSRGPL